MKYSDLKAGVVFIYEDQPYQVLKADFLRKQQRKPVMQTEIKSLVSGKVLQRNFHMNESLEEADIEKEDIKYLYCNKGEFWFCDIDNPGNRFSLEEEVVGSQMQFVKENSEVKAIKFNDEVIGVEVPIKMDLEVKDTPPNVKGNTASGGDKVAELETGAKVTVPLHINVGDIVRVNTQTGDYDTRTEKAKGGI